MGLSRAEMMRLEEAVLKFALHEKDANCERYLVEAADCVSERGDPLDALRLLDALWNSAYAYRPAPMRGLNEVGSWLGQRLSRHPEPSAEQIELELRWLRRLLIAAKAQVPARRPPAAGQDARQGRPAGPAENTFSRWIPRIEEARARRAAERSADRKALRQATPAAAPPLPDRLPELLAVEFAHLAAARKARHAAKDREKRGKPAKEAWVELRPLDARFKHLTEGLCCSIRCQGLEDLFRQIDAHDGAARPFFVADIQEKGGRRVAGRVFLDGGQ